MREDTRICSIGKVLFHLKEMKIRVRMNEVGDVWSVENGGGVVMFSGKAERRKG